MRKGKVVNLGHLKYIFVFLKNNWCLIFLTSSFMFGIVIGTFNAGNNSGFSDTFIKFTDSYINMRLTENFISIFKQTLITNLAFLILIFIFGTSITGITLVPVLILTRGIIFGALTSIIYTDFALNGIAFTALVLVPPSVISVIALLISAKKSMAFSFKVINITMPNSTPKNLGALFDKFWKQHLILIIPIIISSLLDAWLSIKLIPYFNL